MIKKSTLELAFFEICTFICILAPYEAQLTISRIVMLYAKRNLLYHKARLGMYIKERV